MTPTPTPMPAARVSEGDQALAEGDYERALQEYQAALADATDEEIQAAAQVGIGRVHFLNGDYANALTALRAAIDRFPNSTHKADAYFFLAETYTALSRYSDAAEAYATFLQLNPGVLDSYIQERRGDVLVSAGDYNGAISAYQAALDAPHLGSAESTEIKLAKAFASSGDAATALSHYQTLFSTTQDEYTKAQLDLLMGQAALALGDAASAYERFQDAVNNYPRSYDSYSALVALVNAGIEVNELNRGLVDYYAGQYGAALDAFNRYLAAASPDLAGTAHYYKGLTLIQLGMYTEAISEFDQVIQNYKADKQWVPAWAEKAFVQWAYLNQYDAAAQTLLDFVAVAPNDPQAPANLFEAARILERNNELDRAAQTWERMADTYPSDPQTIQALIFAGVVRYRLKDYQAAQTTFQRALLLATAPGDQAAALLWIGKTQQALNLLDDARKSWEAAMSRDPTGYYSERARDLLLNRAPFTPEANTDLGYDLNTERAEAEEWMRNQFNLPAETDLDGLGELANDPRMIRGRELWRLGQYAAARNEFEDLRKDVATDPVATFRLTGFFENLGLYRSAILASRQVLTLAGMDDAASLTAPIYFNHIRFGIYYRQMVIDEARTDDFDPLFVFSVIRQESLFEGFIISSAGARGLMQIIPSTGQSLAAALTWPPNYTANDLYRPMVSIRLGVHYLAQQRNYFDGDLYAALAAYNGGPGNASVWHELAGGDPDLFLETVRIQETRNYIMQIYEIYTIYQRIYTRTP